MGKTVAFSTHTGNELSFDDVEYLKKLKPYAEILTRKEEIDLFTKYRDGDDSLEGEIIKRNIGLIVSIGLKMKYKNSKYNIPLSDYVQEGAVGAIKAMRKFDVTKGTKFSTHASIWIEQYMRRYCMDKGGLVRIPVHNFEVNWKIKKAEKAIEKLGLKPTNELISKMTKVRIAEIKRVKAILFYDKQLASVKDLNNLPEKLSDPDEQLDSQGIKDDINILLGVLDEYQKKIIVHRFGLGWNNPLSLRDLGKMFGKSRETVRETVQVALKILKKEAEKRELDCIIK